MLAIISLGLLAGLITGVSPCVLPVLPVIFFAGEAGAEASATRRTARSTATVAGLAVSFAAFTLLGSALLSALHLPAGSLRWCALVILLLVGLGLFFPRVEDLLQRPFRRIPNLSARGSGNAFVFGMALGVLYVPCAGPVLAAISIAGTAGEVNRSVAVLTISFAVGAALPLLIFALAGASLSQRLSSYRRRSRGLRMVAGSVMVLLAIALTFNLTDGLQRTVPNYTRALQDRAENNESASKALSGLAGGSSTPAAVRTDPTSGSSDLSPRGPVVSCISGAAGLANCGPAPAFTGISHWVNTPPITLGQFKGKVVLVNFWTYSCINCQRALPFIKSWYAAYHSSGLEVVGIHTPEFAFEHELGNVNGAVRTSTSITPLAWTMPAPPGAATTIHTGRPNI